MLKLPKNLCALARLCNKDDTRYALNAVRLTEHTEGYRIDASDGRRLAIVTGPGREEDVLEMLAGAPNAAWQALIPAVKWTEAFKLAGGRFRGDSPLVHAVLGEKVTTFAGGSTVLTVENVTGRYPDVNAVAADQYSLWQVRVDALLFAELLQVAAAIADGAGDGHTVTLHFQGRDRPLLVTANNSEGQKFQAAIMPLS